MAGTDIGGMNVDHSSGKTLIDYEYRNNGRGPTVKEEIVFADNGLPMKWNITGASTFGNKIDEQFSLSGTTANWTDATGSGSQEINGPALYVDQDGSPYSLWLYARALLADADNAMPVLPGGTLRIEEIENLTVTGEDGEESLTSYALSGISLNPTYIS